MLENAWLEFGRDGRALLSATAFTPTLNARDITSDWFEYIVSGDTVTFDGRPMVFEFPAPGKMRLFDVDLGYSLSFRRSLQPVLGTDVAGWWSLDDGTSEDVVTLLPGIDMPLQVRFYRGGTQTESGTWSVSADGLVMEMNSGKVRVYTEIVRDGERITLTGDGVSLVLLPLAPEAVPEYIMPNGLFGEDPEAAEPAPRPTPPAHDH